MKASWLVESKLTIKCEVTGSTIGVSEGRDFCEFNIFMQEL